MNQIENQREAYYRKAGVAPGLPTMKGSYADPEVTGVGYNVLIDSLGDHSVPENWVQHPVVNTEAGSNPGAPLAWGSPENPDDVVAGYGYVAADTSEVEETFYYHSDHLGSTAYITDQKANVTQYDAYLPYGELLVDEHSSSTEMPYKFNGKELDEETGLYYYGARYMNPVTSMWYGVDPLTEQYVNIGAYIYCHGNPIVLIDPDGQGDYFAKNGKHLGSDNKTDNAIYVAYKGGNVNFSVDGNNMQFTRLMYDKEIFIALASVINEESSGNRDESLVFGNVIMNFIKDGGSLGKNNPLKLKTLEDVTLYKNSFVRGAKQSAYSEFCSKNWNERNSESAIESAINAIGYFQGLNGFSDYSEGANTWDGKDLVMASWPNSHRTYKWSESSKPLLTKYISLVGTPRKTSKGIKSIKTINIDDFSFSSTNKSVQIQACRIVGLTLFTKLLTGRGEGKDKKHPERFR